MHANTGQLLEKYRGRSLGGTSINRLTSPFVGTSHLDFGDITALARSVRGKINKQIAHTVRTRHSLARVGISTRVSLV